MNLANGIADGIIQIVSHHNFTKTNNRIERCAHLVTHICEKDTLRLRRCHSFVLFRI
ncbi:MAG: DUF4041 domain-containing protein [Clostridiales Family XIII bacterium]|nr:DUF4041 domain-containing protein [Clostridiales Family XIII bacterium]